MLLLFQNALSGCIYIYIYIRTLQDPYEALMRFRVNSLLL